MPLVQSRRRFLSNLAFAGAAGAGGVDAAGLGGTRKSLAAEPPPEITRIRLCEQPITCFAPNWVARELLYGEGFTDVQFMTWAKNTQNTMPEVLLSGEVDISLSFIPTDLIHIDAGSPAVWLAGSHIGCVELFGNDRVRSTRDLKGKTVAIGAPRGPEQIFVSMFAAYVGLDPQKDIHWVINSDARDKERQLAEGNLDAYMSGPPFSQELREKKIGHVLVNTTTDKPWSQYLCCMISSTREFVRRYPVATKRALRALLKATDLCASEPERIARLIADRDVPPIYNWHYDYILQGLKEIPYGQWRDYDPEDAVRFHALWMRDVGMIKNSPQKLIAEHTDWRFLNELKRELKV
jgi:NitT/TauT family transport system substrate-binding protein